MTAETASTAPTARLRRNVLDLPQVVFQGITHIAPSINVVFTFPIIALKAGPAMPISFLLTTIVCFFIGNTVWVLTHFGIRLSMRTTVIFGAIEMAIMLALAITFLAEPGKGSSYTAPIQVGSLVPHGFGGVLAGMVFSVLALSGFEAPAPLAQETRRPGRFIGRAVMWSLFAIGGFYVFTSYASAIGWGTGNMPAFASSANPYYALGHALWGAGWWFVVIAIINSAIGVGLACTNAASRVMYTMGQAGTLPPQFGRINPKYRTPTFAIAFIQLSGIVAILLVGLLLVPGDIFGFLGTITTLAVIILYVMANLALTAYIRREHPGDFNMWRHGVLPWVGTLALLPVLFVTVYPVPSWPVNITPYIFIAALIVGFGYMQRRERRHPGVLRRGASVLVGQRTDAQGDVDWDAPAQAGPQAGT